MENLTKEMGLVGKLEEPRPKPGYTLVVFREVDGGHELVDTLPDGARFRPGLLAGLGKRFRARAVTTDPALRDHFDVRLSAVGGSESVHVNLTVHLIYSIVSPATVAMRVDKDPLRRLRKEIEAVLESEALKVDRKGAENKAFDLEGALLHLREFQRKASDGRGNLDRFRSFAQSLGFDLQTVEIVRTPTAEELDEAKGLEKQERVRRELAQTEITKRFEANETEETKRVRIGAARPTRLMEVDADKDVESLRADRDFSIHAVKRVTYLMDQGVERLNEALKTIAHNTDSARSLRETMRELVGLRQELGAGMLQAADGGGPGGRFLAAEAPPACSSRSVRPYRPAGRRSPVRRDRDDVYGPRRPRLPSLRAERAGGPRASPPGRALPRRAGRSRTAGRGFARAPGIPRLDRLRDDRPRR